MTSTTDNDTLLLLKGPEVADLLDNREHDVIAAVRRAYELHGAGDSSLPWSSFLRFPANDVDRIISLPAYLGGDLQLAGLKWIASVPANVAKGLERASAVMILNRRETGRAQAILEGSIVSKKRTAASAALGAKVLRQDRPPRSIGFVGCGPINLEIGRFLAAVWPEVERFQAFDLDRERASRFGKAHLGQVGTGNFTVAASLEELLATSDLVAFATTAVKPHLADLSPCQDGTTILHISLRDLTPEVILAHHNVVDDLNHVNRAATSIHLASEHCGNTDFVHGSLGAILLGQVGLPPEEAGRLSIFSPFGMGILDLAVAHLACELAKEQDVGMSIQGFFP